MARDQFSSPVEAALVLVANEQSKNTGGHDGRRAQYRAAEVEAWEQWERHGKQNEAAMFWAQTAATIANEFHNPTETDDEDELVEV